MKLCKKFSYSESECYLKTIFELSDYSDDLYLVGGCLRDWVCSKKTNDIDFAFSTDPKYLAEKVSQYFRSPMIILDAEFFTYRIVCTNFVFDFSKFKGCDILSDLKNRDFSLNSMGIQLSQLLKERNFNSILDPMYGQQSIQDKIVIQNKELIYNEDPLRLLRAYRISSQMKFRIHDDTIKTIKKNRHLISLVSMERIKEELLLLLDNTHSYTYFLSLDQSGVLTEIVDEIQPLKTCAVDYYAKQGETEGVWGHSLSGLKYLEWILNHLDHEFPEYCDLITRNLYCSEHIYEGHTLSTILKLGILFHDIGKPKTARIINNRWRFFNHPIVGSRIISKILSRLKFSRRTTECVSSLVNAHMRAGGLANLEVLSDRAQYRFFRDMDEYGIAMLIVSLADHYTYIPNSFGYNKDKHEVTTKNMVRWFYKNQQEKFIKPKKIIDGHQIMQTFQLQPGPIIGDLLKYVQEEIALGNIQMYDQAVHAIHSKLKCNQ